MLTVYKTNKRSECKCYISDQSYFAVKVIRQNERSVCLESFTCNIAQFLKPLNLYKMDTK